jgi:predicted lipoprotein with Yx(FWY)xxD motif
MENSRKRFSLLITLLLASIVFSCSDDDYGTANEPPEPLGVELSTSDTFGQYLSDNNGKALYYFTPDFSGSSTCSGGCLAAWPAFYMEANSVGNGLNAADFGTITRDDGAKQTTYNGWPLYYFAGDSKSGDINGDDADEEWYVAKPDYSLMVADNADGEKYIVDASGKTLYRFTNDSENTSTCQDGCIVNFPAFLDDTLTLPSFFDPADFSTITRVDGAKQTTYKGIPLYYFSQDQVRGEAKGEGFGGKWFIVTDLK